MIPDLSTCLWAVGPGFAPACHALARYRWLVSRVAGLSLILHDALACMRYTQATSDTCPCSFCGSAVSVRPPPPRRHRHTARPYRSRYEDWIFATHERMRQIGMGHIPHVVLTRAGTWNRTEAARYPESGHCRRHCMHVIRFWAAGWPLGCSGIVMSPPPPRHAPPRPTRTHPAPRAPPLYATSTRPTVQFNGTAVSWSGVPPASGEARTFTLL